MTMPELVLSCSHPDDRESYVRFVGRLRIELCPKCRDRYVTERVVVTFDDDGRLAFR